MALSKCGASPSMEQLRDNVEPGPNLDFMIIELRSISYQTHAGFLFLDEERNTLRRLCRSVGNTDVEKPYSNWKDFAYCLGLETDDIKHIDLYCKDQEGPVLVALATFVQKDDATLEKVIQALNQTNRLDAIKAINDGVRELVSRVANYPMFIDSESGICRPTTFPWVPCALELPKVSSKSTNNNINKIINNAITFLEKDRGGIVQRINPNTPLAARVMLTFANDGAEAASRIAQTLRSYNPRIGVLILKEQQGHYSLKTREFINDCIEQVDFIIPILTKGYYDTIRGRRTAAYEQIGRFAVDQQYAKYIYSSYSSEFLRHRCQHKRVRCLLPNNEEYDPFWRVPELEIWFRESEMDEFVDLILSEDHIRR